jgi:hypothetical protein
LVAIRIEHAVKLKLVDSVSCRTVTRHVYADFLLVLGEIEAAL